MPGSSPPDLVRPFTRRLLAVDLPGLPADRRDEVAAFTAHRIDGLPSPLRLGVRAVAAALGPATAAPGGRRMLGWVLRHRPPVAGEYVRLVRSLAYTYVWERWPDTRVDGSAAR